MHRIFLRVGLLVFLAGFVSAPPTRALTPAVPQGGLSPAGYLPVIIAPPPSQEAQIIALVNQERANAATPCAPVVNNTRLSAAAEGHSQDMATNNFFSHTGSNGSSFIDRIEAQGYQWSAGGENIAAGNSTAQATMDQWMNSSGHRANILNCNYTEIGVGYYYDSSSTYDHYWTQVFARPAQ